MHGRPAKYSYPPEATDITPMSSATVGSESENRGAMTATDRCRWQWGS